MTASTMAKFPSIASVKFAGEIGARGLWPQMRAFAEASPQSAGKMPLHLCPLGDNVWRRS